jgi:hypothetical protein
MRGFFRIPAFSFGHTLAEKGLTPAGTVYLYHSDTVYVKCRDGYNLLNFDSTI